MAEIIADLRRKCVSLREGSKILGVSEMTFRRILRSGQIKSFRIGGCRSPYRVAIDEIEAFIKRSSYPKTDEDNENMN